MHLWLQFAPSFDWAQRKKARKGCGPSCLDLLTLLLLWGKKKSPCLERSCVYATCATVKMQARSSFHQWCRKKIFSLCALEGFNVTFIPPVFFLGCERRHLFRSNHFLRLHNTCRCVVTLSSLKFNFTCSGSSIRCLLLMLIHACSLLSFIFLTVGS